MNRQIKMSYADKNVRLTLDETSKLIKVEVRKEGEDSTKFREVSSKWIGKVPAVGELEEVLKEVTGVKPIKKGLFECFDSLKEQLFDAPTDVKESFNEVIKYFDGKGKGKGGTYDRDKADKLWKKFRETPESFTMRDFQEAEEAEIGEKSNIREYAKANIPGFYSLISLDTEVGPGVALLNSELKSKSKYTTIWNNGQKAPYALWINEYTTPEGDKFWELMDNYYGTFAVPKKTYQAFKFKKTGQIGKGGPKYVSDWKEKK